MIRINLIPPSARKAAASILPTRLPLRSIAIAIGVLVVVISLGIMISQRSSTAALKRLVVEWEDLRERRMEVEGVQQSLKALGSRATVMESVKGEGAKWAPRLNLLTDALVANLWFTELQYGDISSETELVDPLSTPFLEEAAPSLDELPPEFIEADGPGAGGAGSDQEDLDAMFRQWAGSDLPDPGQAAAPPPELVLKGSTLVAETGAGSSVRRFLQRLKEHSNFERWFERVELKAVEHRQIGYMPDAGGVAFESFSYEGEEEASRDASLQPAGQSYEVSDFVIVFRPTGVE